MKKNPSLMTTRIALVSLGLSAAALSQTAMLIENSGFEDPVLGDGVFDPGGVPGWAEFNGGTTGVLNPGGSDFTTEAPELENVALATSSNAQDGLSQTLSGNLAAGATYDLTVEVGNSKIAGFPGYRVQLLAGGEVLVEDDNLQTVAEDSFVTVNLNYVYDPGQHAGVVGEALEIRLLSKGTTSGSEVAFDDVRLSATLEDPFADAGGPYSVAPGGSVSLDASGSLPSDGQTIASYEWDLNGDGTFGDVTGVTPTAISFDDLQNVWDMVLGNNTVGLRITDSDGKTSTESTVVALTLAEVTAGFDFLVDAAEAADEDTEWSDLVEGNPSGLGLLLDDSPAVTRVTASTNSRFSHAYDFPGGETGNSGGALLVESGTTNTASFQNAPGDWSTNAVTMEIWFKPDNIAPVPENGQILFEDGGGSGLGLFIRNNELLASQDSNEAQIGYNLETDPEGLLRAPATTEFIQVVLTRGAGGATEMFVNGVSVGTSTDGDGDWSGGDSAAFGTRGGSNTGGYGGGQQNTESFDGQIALIRIYDEQILTPEEVDNNFKAFSAPDVDPPEIAALNPEDGSTGVYPGIESLSVTFNEDVTLTGNGAVTLKNLDDSSGSSDVIIDLPDSSVELAGRSLTITPVSNLDFGTAYAVRISADAINDVSGNAFAGTEDDTTWNFTTAEQNLNAPVITVKSPEDDAEGASIATAVVATFDQNILLGSGDIVIEDLADNSTTLTIPVTDSSQVTLVDNMLTVDPASLLESDRAYAVRIAPGAVKNFSDVDFAGISNDTDWNFTTGDLGSQLGILDLTANNGLNPATGEPWKVADSYRLTFITSTDSYPASPDIGTYNAEIQALADASPLNLSPVTWKVIGSTPTVDARDNTLTNPEVNGDGHSIFLLDGSTVIAGDFNELWSGTVRNPINIMDNGSAFDRTGWPYTGTKTDGTARTGGPDFGAFGVGGNIGQGSLSDNSWWIWRVWTGSEAQLPYYGMSDRLFVIDSQDETQPSFVSFADDVAGGPIVFPDDNVVYTVTFDEAMLPSTVDAADFENAGSAGISIDSIVQQADPAVFEVTVSPLGEGSIQLRIPAGAGMTDLAGNSLDTTTAFTDDTVITVTGGTPFGNWADGFAGLSDSDPSLDFDGGGLDTGIEWVVGGDPTDPNDDAGLAPTLDNTTDPDFFIFTYRRTDEAAADANTTISVEYGSDLVGWTDAVAGADVQIDETADGFGAGVDQVDVKIRRTLAVDGKLFVRLSATVGQ